MPSENGFWAKLGETGETCEPSVMVRYFRYEQLWPEDFPRSEVSVKKFTSYTVY